MGLELIAAPSIILRGAFLERGAHTRISHPILKLVYTIPAPELGRYWDFFRKLIGIKSGSNDHRDLGIIFQTKSRGISQRTRSSTNR